jgi:hypothetical protein
LLTRVRTEPIYSLVCTQVASIAIKVNIIDTLEAKISENEATTNSALDFKNRIFGSKIRSPKKVLKEQKKHLESYLYYTMQNNKTMLPALLDPAPLLAQPEPKAMTVGCVSEVANILQGETGIEVA